MRAPSVLVIATCLLLLAVPCGADDRADQAIRDAVDLLKARQAKLSEPAEVSKLDDAIARLQRPDRATRTQVRRVTTDAAGSADELPALPSVNVVDFMDHTERYRGQIITLPVMVRSSTLIPRGQTLRDLAGGPARFQGRSEDGNRLDLLVDLPRALDIPKVTFGDRVIISFRCRDGDLQHGNEAVAVRRPGQE